MAQSERQREHISEVFKSAEEVYYRSHGNTINYHKDRVGGTTKLRLQSDTFAYYRSDTFVNTRNHA